MRKDWRGVDGEEVRTAIGLMFLIAAILLVLLLVLNWRPWRSVEAASPIGPWIGLRTPMYDTSRKGLANPYWLMKLPQEQWEIVPDPAGASDGFLRIKFPPAVPQQSYSFGSGFVTIASPGLPTQVIADTAYMLHLTLEPAAPAVGSYCPSSGAVWAGAEGFFYAVPNSTRTGFVWAKATDPTALRRVWLTTGLPPVLGASCADVGENSVWIGAQGLYVCIPDSARETFVWAGAPLQTAPPVQTGTVLPPEEGSACGEGGKWSEENGLLVCSVSEEDPPMWVLVPMPTG